MFKPGHKKVGGRKKGSLNKVTTDLFAKLESIGLDPFTELAKIAQADDNPDLRFQALKELCQYLFPKRKAMEVTNKIDPQVMEEAEALMNLSDEELIEVARHDLKKLAGGPKQ